MVNRKLGEKAEGKKMYNKKLWVAIGLLVVVIFVALVLINAELNNEPETLTYQEAKLLHDEIGGNWNALNNMESYSNDEIILLENIVASGIYKNDEVIVTLLDNSDESIELFWEYILEGVENADAVIFEKGGPVEPVAADEVTVQEEESPSEEPEIVQLRKGMQLVSALRESIDENDDTLLMVH